MATDLDIVGGLPFSRRIRVSGGAAVWETEDDFQLRSHIRGQENMKGRLKFDLTPYLSADIEEEDIVVNLVLTGRETALVPSGYYDVVISDADNQAARAIVILAGKINLSSIVTGFTNG